MRFLLRLQNRKQQIVLFRSWIISKERRNHITEILKDIDIKEFELKL